MYRVNWVRNREQGSGLDRGTTCVKVQRQDSMVHLDNWKKLLTADSYMFFKYVLSPYTLDLAATSLFLKPGIPYSIKVVAAAAAKSFQSCPTLCDPIDGSPPGSPVPGILQARTLEWVVISFSSARKWKVKVKSLSRVQLLVTPWTAAYQGPPSMGFSRQEYWSGVPLPCPGISDYFPFIECTVCKWNITSVLGDDNSNETFSLPAWILQFNKATSI